MAKKSSKQFMEIPAKLLAPIREFLESEIVKWKRAEKKMKRNDPFSDPNRLMQNSNEEDADEQIGHFETELKVGFVKKQLVQLHKALTMIKIGKYGICERCGQMIDTDRLSVKPEVTICIKCARDRE